ncbi:hypothetical protein LDV99_004568 [Vibrio parahaemolyticus]|nr:hypothetical protein [Vibrio parahaemolyticus]
MKGLIRFIPLLKNLKSMVFADGKYRLDRAVVIVVLLCIVMSLVHVFGYEQTVQGIELVDELSDVIGYVE